MIRIIQYPYPTNCSKNFLFPVSRASSFFLLVLSVFFLFHIVFSCFSFSSTDYIYASSSHYQLYYNYTEYRSPERTVGYLPCHVTLSSNSFNRNLFNSEMIYISPLLLILLLISRKTRLKKRLAKKGTLKILRLLSFLII